MLSACKVNGYKGVWVYTFLYDPGQPGRGDERRAWRQLRISSLVAKAVVHEDTVVAELIILNGRSLDLRVMQEK